MCCITCLTAHCVVFFAMHCVGVKFMRSETVLILLVIACWTSAFIVTCVYGSIVINIHRELAVAQRVQNECADVNRLEKETVRYMMYEYLKDKTYVPADIASFILCGLGITAAIYIMWYVYSQPGASSLSTIYVSDGIHKRLNFLLVFSGVMLVILLSVAIHAATSSGEFASSIQPYANLKKCVLYHLKRYLECQPSTQLPGFIEFAKQYKEEKNIETLEVALNRLYHMVVRPSTCSVDASCRECDSLETIPCEYPKELEEVFPILIFHPSHDAWMDTFNDTNQKIKTTLRSMELIDTCDPSESLQNALRTWSWHLGVVAILLLFPVFHVLYYCFDVPLILGGVVAIFMILCFVAFLLNG